MEWRRDEKGRRAAKERRGEIRRWGRMVSLMWSVGGEGRKDGRDEDGLAGGQLALLLVTGTGQPQSTSARAQPAQQVV